MHINNANFRDFYLPLVDGSFLALRSDTNRGALVFPCEHCVIAKRFFSCLALLERNFYYQPSYMNDDISKS